MYVSRFTREGEVSFGFAVEEPTNACVFVNKGRSCGSFLAASQHYLVSLAFLPLQQHLSRSTRINTWMSAWRSVIINHGDRLHSPSPPPPPRGTPAPFMKSPRGL